MIILLIIRKYGMKEEKSLARQFEDWEESYMKVLWKLPGGGRGNTEAIFYSVF